MSPDHQEFLGTKDHSNSPFLRFGLVAAVSVLSGSCWNLGWCFALPFIGLVYPIGMPILIERLLPKLSAWRQFGIYVGTVLLSATVQNIFYIIFGRGLNYLLHDPETQLVGFVFIPGEQILLGAITIGVLTMLKRRRVALR